MEVIAPSKTKRPAFRFLVICLFYSFCIAGNVIAQTPAQQKFKNLPVYPFNEVKAINGDWLLGNTNGITKVFKSKNGKDLIITNGLVSRSFRLYPYMACFDFKNVVTGKEMLRSIEPEAEIQINGTSYKVGGLKGQFERGYLKYDWLDQFKKIRMLFNLLIFL